MHNANDNAAFESERLSYLRHIGLLEARLTVLERENAVLRGERLPVGGLPPMNNRETA